MTTRKQAVEGLRDIMQCELFAKDVYLLLDDIITCLKAEDELGFDIWGVKFQDYDAGLYELLSLGKLEDEETSRRLFDKYHHSNRWSGECSKGGD